MTVGVLVNHTFKVAGLAKVSPWVRACAIANNATKTVNCQKPGLSVETLMLLSKTLGFRYEMIWALTNEKLEQLVVNGTADFTLNFLAPTPEKWAQFTYLPPLNFLSVGFVSGPRMGVVSEMPVFRPFPITVWLCLAITFLIIATIVSVAQSSIFDLPKVAFDLFALALYQADTRQRQTPKISISILMVAFAMFLLLINTVYSSLLVSSLCPTILPSQFEDTDSLARLVEEGQRKIFSRTLRSTYFSRITNTSAPAHNRMWDALGKNPPRYYTNELDVVPNLRADRSLVTPMSSLTYASLVKQYGICAVQFVKDRSMEETWESIVTRKDFPYSSLFSKTIQERLQATILAIADRDYYYHEGPSCKGDPETTLIVRLENMRLIFAFWLGGLFLAFMVYLIEIFSVSTLRKSIVRLCQIRRP